MDRFEQNQARDAAGQVAANFMATDPPNEWPTRQTFVRVPSAARFPQGAPDRRGTVVASVGQGGVLPYPNRFTART